jgi:predicted nucleic acid-binding protein
MPITSETQVFFDAACLIAAAASASGGSAFVLTVGQRGFLRICSSQSVLIEAERNIRTKLRPTALIALQRLVETPLIIVPSVPASLVQHYADSFREDSHVVAAALAARADYLLTLDRRLIERVESNRIPIQARTPGDFIQQDLPGHVSFSDIR